MADPLNKVVGDGGTLSGPERQLFIGMTSGEASPEKIAETRINALIRRWMEGGRLSTAERDEVAHLLPDAKLVNTEPTPLPQRPGAMVEDDILSTYEISRAKFFRWKQAGEAVPDGRDPPPFEDPKAMVQWYERMRERGVFKHKCPAKLKALASKGLPSTEKTASRSPQTSEGTSSKPSSGSAPRAAPERRGFLVEFEELEAHVAQLREDYKQAYADGDDERGAMLKTRYFEAFTLLNKAAKEKPDICEREGSMVKLEDVEQDLEAIITGIVQNLVSRQHMRAIYDELGLEALSLPFELFSTVMQRQQRSCFSSLVRSRFAPPLALEES